MQHIDIIAVGRIREQYLSTGINEYLKRLQPYARVRTALSFSHCTFPHQLMRLILLEQLYRAYKIQRSETYHR